MLLDIESFEIEEASDGEAARFTVRAIRDVDGVNTAQAGVNLAFRMAAMWNAAFDPTKPAAAAPDFEVSLDLTPEEAGRALDSAVEEGTDGTEGQEQG